MSAIDIRIWPIADKLADEVERICHLSPRPMSWTNLDANTRCLIASLALEALDEAGYDVLPRNEMMP
jgi:hypothetical protein